MENLKLIGYWYSDDIDDINYPDPKKFINKAFYENYKIDGYYKAFFCRYLDNCLTCNYNRGYSQCRICGKQLGTFERTDLKYIWPDQLSHYVMEHDVMLPVEFLNHIKDQACYAINQIDMNFWINSMNLNNK